MNPLEIINIVIRTIPKYQLADDLAAIVVQTLKIGVKDGKVTDVVLAELSKHVEVRLREIYQEFTSEKLAEGGELWTASAGRA